jgi:hypothetical protein
MVKKFVKGVCNMKHLYPPEPKRKTLQKVKTKMKSATRFDDQQKAKVTESYCNAVQKMTAKKTGVALFEVNVECELSEFSSTRRLLAGFSYELSANIQTEVAEETSFSETNSGSESDPALLDDLEFSQDDLAEIQSSFVSEAQSAGVAMEASAVESVQAAAPTAEELAEEAQEETARVLEETQAIEKFEQEVAEEEKKTIPPEEDPPEDFSAAEQAAVITLLAWLVPIACLTLA